MWSFKQNVQIAEREQK